MTRHLCISVTLLDGFFHGKCDKDAENPDGRPEWPPSPMRLFQALVAGSRTGCRNGDWSEAKAEAFGWLERRDPPLIVAPKALPAAAYTLFVPNNDSDKKFDRQDRLTSKIVRPHRMASGTSEAAVGTTLHYLWGIPEHEWAEGGPHAEVLCREARHLMALGWGIDQAVAYGAVLTEAQIDALTGARWRPWPHRVAGSAGFRVPKGGSLKDLERAHASFLNRVRVIHQGRTTKLDYQPEYRPRCFDYVAYSTLGVNPPRPFSAFALRPVDPDARSPWRAFRQERAVCVAAMLRHAAWEAAKSDLDVDPSGQLRPGTWRTQEWAEQFVAGHGPRKENGRFVDDNWPRFSYLALPTIDPRGVVGMIRRVLIVEPLPQFGGDGRSAAWAANRLRGMALRDAQTGDNTALLEQLADGDAVVARYVARDNFAHEWVSVTPVILPGYDDAKPAKRERLLRQCLMHVGYEVAVESIDARSAAWLPGCPPMQSFRRPAYLRHLPAFHVRIRFRAPTAGPVALGAGRHCGLGVFARVA